MYHIGTQVHHKTWEDMRIEKSNREWTNWHSTVNLNILMLNHVNYASTMTRGRGRTSKIWQRGRGRTSKIWQPRCGSQNLSIFRQYSTAISNLLKSKLQCRKQLTIIWINRFRPWGQKELWHGVSSSLKYPKVHNHLNTIIGNF